MLHYADLSWQAMGVIAVIAVPLVTFVTRHIWRMAGRKKEIDHLVQAIDNERLTRQEEVKRIDSNMKVMRIDINLKATQAELSELRRETNTHLHEIRENTNRILLLMAEKPSRQPRPPKPPKPH